MTAVWVLSDESPFDNPEVTGGCVIGVFATLEAAVFELVTWELERDALAEMTWTQVHKTYYQVSARSRTYILRRHEVHEEVALRTDAGTSYAELLQRLQTVIPKELEETASRTGIPLTLEELGA